MPWSIGSPLASTHARVLVVRASTARRRAGRAARARAFARAARRGEAARAGARADDRRRPASTAARGSPRPGQPSAPMPTIMIPGAGLTAAPGSRGEAPRELREGRPVHVQVAGLHAARANPSSRSVPRAASVQAGAAPSAARPASSGTRGRARRRPRRSTACRLRTWPRGSRASGAGSCATRTGRTPHMGWSSSSPAEVEQAAALGEHRPPGAREARRSRSVAARWRRARRRRPRGTRPRGRARRHLGAGPRRSSGSNGTSSAPAACSSSRFSS